MSSRRPSTARPTGEPNFKALRLAAHLRRQALGLTLKEVVARAGIAESTVTGALYGYHEGSVRTWRAIACALEMRLGELIDHLDDPYN